MTRAGTFVRRNFEPLVLSAQVLLDLVTVVLACLTAWYLREAYVGELAGVPLATYRGVFAITTAVCLVCFHRFGMYSPAKSLLNVEEFKGVAKASVTAFLVVHTMLVLLRGSSADSTSLLGRFAQTLQFQDDEMGMALLSYSRVTTVSAFVFVLGFTLVARFISFKVIQNLHRRGIGNRNVLVIGTGPTAQSLQRKFLLVPTLGLNFVGFVDDDEERVGDVIERSRVIGTLDDIEVTLGKYKVSEVFVALPEANEDKVIEIVTHLEQLGITYFVVPRFYHLMRYNVRIEDLDSIPLIARVELYDSFSSRVAKRSFDLAVSTAVMLVAAPFFMLSALWIKRDTPGPVFFRQTRIGKDGRPFQMIKFRTMHLAQCGDEATPSSESDPRITKVGRILRRYSLDEMPNFINVLKGEMSVVGPRPEMPFIVESYGPEHRERLRAKPGITGLWQISYARQTAIHDNLDYDLYYIENQSLLLDLVILALTGFAVVKGTGAY